MLRKLRLLLAALVLGGVAIPAVAQPLGSSIIAEPLAQRFGLHRAWVAHADIDSAIDRIETVLVQGDGVFVQSVRGVVQLFDAETGASRWVARLGNGKYPTSGVGADDKHVAVCTGVSVYLLDRANGDVLWEKTINRTPSAPPAVTADRVYVPSVDGTVLAISIAEPTMAPLLQRSSGGVFCEPVARGGAISWGTETGRVYGARLDRDKFDVIFQVTTGGAVAAVSSHGNTLYVVSRDWYLYAFNQQDGTELWRFSAGDPVHHVPVPIGNVVYLVSEQNGLFCVNAADGSERWSSPGIRQLLSVNDQRLYATDETGRLTILDARSGARLASVPTGQLSLLVTNLATDRLYVGSDNGVIQGLHELGRDKPMQHQVVEEKPATTQKPLAEPGDDEEVAAPAEEPPAEGDDDDPFN